MLPFVHVADTSSMITCCFFVVVFLQTVINKQWSALAWEERAQLRTALYQLLLQRHTSVATFVRNKLVKLVVDIARLDWPHFYPDFLTNIIQVSSTEGIHKLRINEQVLLKIMCLFSAVAECRYSYPRPCLCSNFFGRAYFIKRGFKCFSKRRTT